MCQGTRIAVSTMAVTWRTIFHLNYIKHWIEMKSSILDIHFTSRLDTRFQGSTKVVEWARLRKFALPNKSFNVLCKSHVHRNRLKKSPSKNIRILSMCYVIFVLCIKFTRQRLSVYTSLFGHVFATQKSKHLGFRYLTKSSGITTPFWWNTQLYRCNEFFNNITDNVGNIDLMLYINMKIFIMF